MSDERIEKIQSLINDGIGDLGRLQHILNSLEQGKTLFSSDKQYLDSLFEKYPTKESQQPQTEEKPSEIQELRKKIQELEKKVGKKSESEKTDDIEDLRRRIAYEKKQRELKQEAEYMKKDIGTITLVAVIGGLFGINGLGHFMIGKKGTGVGYLVGGIIAMAFFGVVTMGYGAILPWIIFLVVSTHSARASTKVWNEYIELFVKEPTWKAIQEFIKEYSKPSPKPQPQSKPQTKQKTPRTRKDSVLIVMGIILVVVVAIWLIDNNEYDINLGAIGDIFDGYFTLTPSQPTIEGLTEFQVGIIENYYSEGQTGSDGLTRDEKIESYRQYNSDWDAGIIFKDGYNKYGFDEDGFDRYGRNAEQIEIVGEAYQKCISQSTVNTCEGGLCPTSDKSKIYAFCNRQSQSLNEQFQKENRP